MPRRTHSRSASKSPKRSFKSPRRQTSPPKKLPPQGQSQNQCGDKHKVYISGIPKSFPKEDFKQICNQFGKVLDINVVYKDTHCFAFVQYEKQAQVQEAVRKMSEIKIHNQSIRCQKARPRDSRQNSNGFREGQKNGAARDGEKKGKGCYQCGKEGHIARFCPNREEENNNHKSRQRNEDKRESKKQSRYDRRSRSKSQDSSRSRPKKRKDRRRSSSSSSLSSASKRKRDRRRKESSSRSNDRRKGKRHNRSRSAELKKGKKRQASSSSSSR